MEGEDLLEAMARRRRGGSTPEPARSLPRLATSMHFAARCVLCSRNTARWKRGTGAPPHQSLSLPTSASKRACFFAFGAASFPLFFRNEPSLRADFGCPVVLPVPIFPFSSAGFLGFGDGSRSARSVASCAEVSICLGLCRCSDNCLEALLFVELELPLCA